jgi:lysophospholipase L1-like esterase
MLVVAVVVLCALSIMLPKPRAQQFEIVGATAGDTAAWTLSQPTDTVHANGRWTTLAVSGFIGSAVVGATSSYTEWFTQRRNARIAQDGDVLKVEMFSGALTLIDSVKVRFWRYVSGTSCALLDSTENLLPSITPDATNTVTLTRTVPLLEGDYYSVIAYKSSGSGSGIVLGLVDVGSPGDSKVFRRTSVQGAKLTGTASWETQTLMGDSLEVQVRLHMRAPHVLFVGDSWVSGSPSHRSYFGQLAVSQDHTRDVPDSCVVNMFQDSTAYVSQNMGYGGYSAAQARADFLAYGLNREPAMVVLLAGANDLRNGDSTVVDSTVYANIKTVADSCEAHGIKLAICELPQVSDYTDRMSEDAWYINQQLKELVRTHPGENVLVEVGGLASLKSGALRVDGRQARYNLWEFKAGMLSSDGVHPNINGYGYIRDQIIAAMARGNLD